MLLRHAQIGREPLVETVTMLDGPKFFVARSFCGPQVLIEACPVGELVTDCRQIVIKSRFVATPNPTGMGNQNDHDPVRRRLREFPDEPL